MPRKSAQSKIARSADFDGLVGRISAVSDALRDDALAVVNRSVTARAWITGYYIVEYEQHGRDRAKYGERLLPCIEERLGRDSFSVPSLKKYRQFYQLYPDLAAPVVGFVADRLGKGYSPIIQLPPPPSSIGESAIIRSATGPIVEKPGIGPVIAPQVLFSRLSYTHILQLLPLPDSLQRTFYAYSAIRGTWSVRELRRQIGSRLYERSGWSSDPAKLARLTTAGAEKATARESLRAPHVFESEVGAEMAEYVNTFVDPGLFISKFAVRLPPREKIADFLRRENEQLAARPSAPRRKATTPPRRKAATPPRERKTR